MGADFQNPKPRPSVKSAVLFFPLPEVPSKACEISEMRSLRAAQLVSKTGRAAARRRRSTPLRVPRQAASRSASQGMR